MILKIHHENYNGHKYTWYYREWDIKNCEFDTYEDAVSYFVYYLRKYRNIDLKTTPIDPTAIAEEYAKENFTQDYADGCTDSDHFDWLDWFDNKYGIGRYSAIHLVKSNAKVIFACRTEEKAKKALEEIPLNLRKNAEYIYLDLCRFDSIITIKFFV